MDTPESPTHAGNLTSPLDRTATSGRSAEAPAPNPGRLRRKRWNAGMQIVRRVHLYSGLFMFPFVLLYGVTGLFFNHPRWFTGADATSFSAANVAEGRLVDLPGPAGVAADVVARINATRAESADADTTEVASPGVVLTSVRPPQYTSDFTFVVRAEEVEHTVSIDPTTGGGVVRTQEVEPPPAEEPPPAPLADVGRIDLDPQSNPLLIASDSVPALLAELDLPTGEASNGRRTATLQFSAAVDGRPCVVNFNLGNGFVSVVPEDDKPEQATKSFLQRLHLARGFPPHWNVRWLWALVVDAMVVSMVFWGVSGMLMWWQIKRTRWLGGAFVVASAVFAGMLVGGMHDSLAVGGGRGQRGQGGGRPGGGGERRPSAAQATFDAESDEETTSPGRPGGRGQRGQRGGGNFGGGRGRGGRGGAANPADSDATATPGRTEADELDRMLDFFERENRGNAQPNDEAADGGEPAPQAE